MFKSRQTLKNKIKELEDQLQDYKDIDSGKKVDEVKADYEDKIKKLAKKHVIRSLEKDY